MSTGTSNKKHDETIEISSKVQWVILGLGFVLMLAMGIYSSTANADARESVSALQNEATALRNELKLKREAEQVVRNEVIYETTGINPERVRTDRTLVSDYIGPAFTWTDGEAYNEARDHYLTLLGDNSQFVDIYLAPNLEVDGHNYIDLHELKSRLVEVELFPLDSEGSSMDYLAVVEYFMYKEDADLTSQGRLQNSKALVNLTVTGEGDDRNVVRIEANPGFNVSTIGN